MSQRSHTTETGKWTISLASERANVSVCAGTRNWSMSFEGRGWRRKQDKPYGGADQLSWSAIISRAIEMAAPWLQCQRTSISVQLGWLWENPTDESAILRILVNCLLYAVETSPRIASIQLAVFARDSMVLIVMTPRPATREEGRRARTTPPVHGKLAIASAAAAECGGSLQVTADGAQILIELPLSRSANVYLGRQTHQSLL